MSRKRTGWSRPRSRDGYRSLSIRSWVQIAAITIIAVAVLISTWQFSEAGGLWQDSVREDVRRSAALQEDVRYVYADEAALGFRVAAAEARADGLRELRNTGRLAASEYTIAAQTAFALGQAAMPDSLIGGAGYVRGDLGYDVAQRLADIRARHPDLRDLNPDATQARANRHATHGTIAAGIGILVAVVAALAACIRTPVPKRRRADYSLSAASLDVDLIPQPALPARGLRYATTLQLAVWALLAILPLAQLLLAGQEQQAQADAARRAVHLTTSIAASGQRTAFLTDSVQAALTADLSAEARELAALDAPNPTDAAEERAMAAAERGIAARLRRIAEAMGRAPTDADDVDRTTVAALDSQPEDWPALQQNQHQQVKLAERASSQGLRVAASTAAAAIAATLAATAVTESTTRRRSRLRWAPAFIILSLTTIATGALL
ncbi:MAG: hypothetical protein M3460_22650 [Actinomycetota bacterium]|nr:hypothetical protein [Actinomycetota bacterium]